MMASGIPHEAGVAASATATTGPKIEIRDGKRVLVGTKRVTTDVEHALDIYYLPDAYFRVGEKYAGKITLLCGGWAFVTALLIALVVAAFVVESLLLSGVRSSYELALLVCMSGAVAGFSSLVYLMYEAIKLRGILDAWYDSHSIPRGTPFYDGTFPGSATAVIMSDK